MSAASAVIGSPRVGALERAAAVACEHCMKHDSAYGSPGRWGPPIRRTFEDPSDEATILNRDLSDLIDELDEKTGDLPELQLDDPTEATEANEVTEVTEDLGHRFDPSQEATQPMPDALLESPVPSLSPTSLPIDERPLPMPPRPRRIRWWVWLAMIAAGLFGSVFGATAIVCLGVL